jgi:hypothetical protein
MKKIVTFLMFAVFSTLFGQTVSIIPQNSSWKYLANGSNQGTAWRAGSFNDATWATGNAEFGYGDGGEATVVSYGSVFNKYRTTYFRKTFSVSNPAAYTNFTLSLLRDDGAVVYLNGVEVIRSNMPSGTIGYRTLASSAISGASESTFYTFTLSTASFVSGTNVLAVEIHQSDATSSDLSFNLKLDGTSAVACATPASLSSSSVTSSSASLSWGAVTGATSYNIRYRVVGTSTWTTTTSTTTSKSVTGLAAGSNYEFQAQAVCAATGAYSASLAFTTLAPPVCGTPSSLGAASITTTTASLSWTAVSGATSYNLRYRIVGAATWLTTASATATKALSGLTANSNYEFQVQAVCSVAGVFSASANFMTLSTDMGYLIAANSPWKYLDNGTNQGTAWRAAAFNDATWASGNAELGYGDGDEATLVGYGTNASAKYITTYFRKSFSVANPSAYTALTLDVVRDDGVVVYINGTEVYRSNMPAGTIEYNTYAGSNIVSESAWNSTSVSPSVLVAGTNVMAVEIHQNTAASTDISFNARFYNPGAGLPATVTRGAYLQKLTPNSVTVRWRTDIPTNSKVQYGTSLSYGGTATDAVVTMEHIVTLTGLTPGTQYFYSIGSATQTIQGDAKNNFYSAPVVGSTAPVRIWGIGDFGNGSTVQLNVRNAFATYAGTTPTNLWIWLGDDAYENGTDAEFQSKVFTKYPDQFKSIPLFPSPGNHDYAQAGYKSTSTLTTNFPYFSIFSVPQNGESGGVASNTPKYYSYNYGNIHFISLDSYGALNNPGSPMYTWLNNDLAANTQRWTIAYFHHPPYTKGSHNSDTAAESVDIRTNIIPLLESYHVDLVLSGHSHDNERSYLIKGHYGIASTFTAAMKVSAETNNFVKTPPYNGTVYAVCGTAGETGSGTQAGYPMPCMFYNNVTYACSLVIDVNGDNLSCKYLASTGAIVDQFNITKSGSARIKPAEMQEADDLYNVFLDEDVITINYSLENDAVVKMELLNVLGQSITSFSQIPAFQPKGDYSFEIPLSDSNFSEGLYFMRITVNGTALVKKIYKVK